MNIARCRALNHWIYDDGILFFCMVDHFKTDQAFALHSKKLLQNIKTATP